MHNFDGKVLEVGNSGACQYRTRLKTISDIEVIYLRVLLWFSCSCLRSTNSVSKPMKTRFAVNLVPNVFD